MSTTVATTSPAPLPAPSTRREELVRALALLLAAEARRRLASNDNRG